MVDASPSLIGRVAMPHFDWMGALFGGPQYMSSYFAQKGAAQQLQEQQGINQQNAQAFLATPEFKAAMEPGSGALWNRWAEAQGGNPELRALSTSLLERGIAQGYGMSMADYQNNLDRQRMDYANTLQKGMVDYNANSQLEMLKKQNAIEGQKTTDAINWLDNPANWTNQYMMDAMARQAGVKIPDNYGIRPTGPGTYTFTPTGGQPLQDMVSELQSHQVIMHGINDMQAMLDKGIDTQGGWDATKTALALEFKNLYKTGALDADTRDALNSMLPGRWDDVTANPSKMNIVRETLRTTQLLMAGKYRQALQKYGLEPGQMRDVSGGPMPTIGLDIPPPPKGGGDQGPAAGTPLLHPRGTIRAPMTPAQRASQGQGGGTTGSGGVMATGKRMWQGSGR